MNSIKLLAVPSVFLALTASGLAAPGEWSFAVKVGAADSVSGDVHRGPDFDGSVLLDLAPGSLPVDVDAKSFDDVYGSFTELGLEASYQQSEHLSYFFGLSQLRSGAGMLRVGTVGEDLPLNGRFSDYEDIGLHGGVRYHFTNESSWQPFVSAQIGLKDVDGITASFSVPGVTFVAPYQAALTDAAFYDGGTVFSYGVGLGVSYRVSNGGAFSVETGYYMQGSMDDDDSVLDVLGLGALNDEGDLDYMPITLRYSFSF